jgi:small subunit ribosomal protein S4
MARYKDAVCRLCRRETAASKTGEKIKLFLKGDRCLSKKCAVERRGTAPGQKVQTTKGRQKISEYGRQLRPGQTGKFFLQLLERRLDNVIYRLNLASSRAQARQLVTHRHFRVNGRIVNVPSFIVKAGDVITIGERSQKSVIFGANIETAKTRRAPEWLEFSETDSSAKVVALPSREQIDTPVDEQLIVEYYSR